MKKIRRLIIIMVAMLVITCTENIVQASSNKDENTIDVLPITKVAATDLDMGDYQSEMSVGEKQLLTVTVIPTTAINQDVSYSSDNTSVATVNGLGRITAVAIGTANITAKVENLTKTIKITVKQVVSTAEPTITVTDVDLGECPSSIQLGETQLLGASVIPSNATNQELTYLSSNPEVATINGLGRVKALSIGSTTITVKSGNISRSFALSVVTKKEETVLATDLDLGEYKKSMQVGASQLVTATVIPTTATSQDVSYSSSNPKVATINGFGRITAIKIGKTKITAKINSIQKVFTLKVVKKTTIKDIDVANFEDEMEIDKTQSISGTIIPSSITGKTIEYSSSNPSIASISSTGNIKGLKKGKTKIILKVGEFKKELKLTVKVATTTIEANKTYLVLKPGERFQLKAHAMPAQADQSLSFESDQPNVATVTSGGLIEAKSEGSAFIFIKNSDSQQAVTVIVNKAGSKTKKTAQKKNGQVSVATTNSLLEQISYGKRKKILYQSKANEVIPTEILKSLYESQKILVIECEGYRITIEGKNIINYENELSTKISLKNEKKGNSFILNGSKNLPGKITIQFLKNQIANDTYVYLYNIQNKKYDRLNITIQKNELCIDNFGKYLLTESKLNGVEINWWILGGGVVIIVGLAIWYIVTKKKYWFW